MRKNLLFFVLLCLNSAIFAQGYSPVFTETFTNYSSLNAGGTFYFEDQKLTLDEKADNKGWGQFQCYESERALKMADKANDGRLTTPAITFTGDKETASEIKIRFKAQAWEKDTNVIHVMIDGDINTTQSVLLDKQNISDRTLPAYEVTFNNVNANSKISFKSSKKTYARFFISEITIFEKVENPAPHFLLSTNWLQFNTIQSGTTGNTLRFSVEQTGLTNPVAYTFDEADPCFTISEQTISANKTDYFVTFHPRQAGISENKITFTDEHGNKKSIVLKGEAFIVTPQLIAANNVTENGFTCNWEAQNGIDEIHLKAYSLENDKLVAEDLFFSKYVEGTSNNRGLEVYNGTGADIFLGDYKITMQENGGGALDKYTFDFPERMLKSGESYCLMDNNSKLTEAKLAADTLIGYPSPCKILYFTGNDALFLVKNGEIIDMIGEENNANSILQDQTIYRKSAIYAPTRKFYAEQWDTYAKDHADNFGNHTMDNEGPVRKYIANEILDPSTTSFEITGAQKETTYFYTIKIKSAGKETYYAPLQEVFTADPNSNTDAAENRIRVYAAGQNLIIDAADTAYTSVYSINGQMILNQTFESGRHTINGLQKGVYIVRINNRSFKICI
ncbi:MAG: lamin tail domain-containing protein [Bacteroidales bacterium]